MASPGGSVPRLPHRSPFLLLDRILEVGARRGAFLKLVTAADPVVAPDGTLPAAFILEALAQGGGALLVELGGHDPAPGYLAGVDDFRTHRPVRVGDALRVEVEILRQVAGATLLSGRALVDGEVVAEGRFTLALPR
jgi:3-hydroxyacyl-[acyl-carrier-protein] dehydratase